MFRKIRTRLEYKILLLMIAVLIVGFGTYVVITIQNDSRALMDGHRQQLRAVSETIMAGIRNIMLTGKAPLTLELVNDARHSLPYGLTIYDRFGREVFLREGEGVVYHVNDPNLHSTLESKETKSTLLRDGNSEVYSRYEPIRNRPECWRCHDPKPSLRGVLQLALRPGTLRTTDSHESVKQMASVMGEFIATAFRTIMLGGQGEQMDTLTAKATDIPAVKRVQVYSRLGYLAFGPEEGELDESEILDILKNNNRELRFQQIKNIQRLFLPLVNEERCQVCHGATFPMRGVMLIDFYADTLKRYLRDPAMMFTAALQSATFEGFRSIMLVARANSARYYMEELRALPIVHTLRVFDADGNERFLNPPPRKRDEIATLVKEKKPIELIEEVGGEDSMVRLSTLANEVRCHSCHGKNHDVRSVVEVSASMKSINATISQNKLRSAAIGGLTILLVWLVIRLFMNSVVVKPVKTIEDVASRIGNGDFTAQATVGSLDEIGKLAERINEMVQGLRERFHLQKFVSQHAVDAVREADDQGLKLGGERRLATVFFSDIRGFTSFSEKVEPERVVAMLNVILTKQASIVRQHGGDIDKYVGDELIAVFEGEKMVQRAVNAALDVQDEIQSSIDLGEKDVINIGIGINTGQMVMGAMGSPERMDYTVIGDDVNLGARLGSAVAPGQILVSEFAVMHAGPLDEYELVLLEPVIVKGKEKPVKVYEVKGRRRKA